MEIIDFPIIKVFNLQVNKRLTFVEFSNVIRQLSPRIRKSKTVLDSGFQSLDSFPGTRFGILY